MTLKDLYKKSKKPNLAVEKIAHYTTIFGFIAFYMWIINLVWNKLSFVFELPKLNYIQTVGILFLGLLIKVFYGMFGTGKGYGRY
jgi:hypothetical protein